MREVELGTLGFYEFFKMKECALGGISIKKILIDKDALGVEKINKALIIGNFFHSLMDKALDVDSDKELKAYAQDLLSDYSKKYSDYIKKRKLGNIKSWTEISNSLRVALKKYAERSYEKSNGEQIKGLLVSKNENFKGLPDYLSIHDNKAILVEYKSTNIYEDDVVNPMYLEQIKFYSMLVLDLFDSVDEVKALLVSLNGKKYEVIYKRDEILDYKNECNSAYETLKKGKIYENLIFDLEKCKFCDKTLFCSEYMKNIVNVDLNIDVFTINGTVSAIAGAKLTIEGYEVKDLPGFLQEEIEVGKEYRLINLTKKNKTYIFGPNTEVYEVC